MSKDLTFSVAQNTDKMRSEYPVIFTIYGDYDDIMNIVESSAYKNLIIGKEGEKPCAVFKSQNDFCLSFCIRSIDILNQVELIINETKLSYDETSLGAALGIAANNELQGIRL